MKQASGIKYKKVMVTGSAGFIGFHLSENLLKQGVRVIGVDIMNDYYDPKMKIKRNALLKKYPKYTFYKVDLTNYKSLEKVIKKEKPEAIIHLAAQAGVRYSLINPWTYGYSNYISTLNVLEVARRQKIKRVLLASSGSVYGKNKAPFHEDHTTDHAISIYGATKKANEVLGHTYHYLANMEVGVMRFFTAYGRFGRPDLALFKFAKNILNEKPIEVYNKGEMIRTFTHVNDLVDAVLAILNKDNLTYSIYNISGVEPIKLMDFISIIEKKLGKKAKIIHKPMQSGDIKEALVNVDKARKELGYNPKVKLKEGIEDFVEWFEENKNWLLKLKEPK